MKSFQKGAQTSDRVIFFCAPIKDAVMPYCNFILTCTYHKELAAQSNKIAEGMIKKYCESGTECVFRYIYESLGRDFRLPLGLAPGNVEKLTEIIERARKKGFQKSNRCWEYQQCPAERRGECPAFLNKEDQYCWVTQQTLCDGKIQGRYVDKIKHCEKCDFYKHRKSVK